MCWYTLDAFSAKGKVASEDIQVFKVCAIYGGQHVVPYYMHRKKKDLVYEESKTYNSNISQQEYICCNKIIYEIHEGLHSYAICGTESLEAACQGCDGFTVSCTFYGASGRIVLCTIPKGSIYYFNKIDGTYVSNQLRIEKIINSRVAYDNVNEINEILFNFKTSKHAQ